MSQLKIMRQIACATMLACTAMGANAASIMIDDPNTLVPAVIIGDQGPLDSYPLAGVITYSAPYGSLGNWIVSVTTGLTKPILGNAELPTLHLDSINVTSLSGGTLDIWFSENNFVGSSGYLANFVSSLGGVATGGSITLDTYLDASNTLFGTATKIDSLDAFSGAGSGADSATVLLPNGPYSLTLHATVTHLSGWTGSSFNAELKVPEPGTLSLLGALLVAAGFVGSRRRVTGDTQSA